MAMLTVRAWSSASRHPPPLPGAPAAEVEPPASPRPLARRVLGPACRLRRLPSRSSTLTSVRRRLRIDGSVAALQCGCAGPKCAPVRCGSGRAHR